MENTVNYEREIFLNSISDIKKKKDGTYVVNYNNLPYHISKSDEMSEKYNWLTEYIEEHPEKAEEYIEKQYIPTAEEIAERERAKRNNLLSEADNLLLKYQEQVELGVISANETYRLDLLRYKQALRDIPEQAGFPDDVEYPALPKLIE